MFACVGFYFDMAIMLRNAKTCAAFIRQRTLASHVRSSCVPLNVSSKKDRRRRSNNACVRCGRSPESKIKEWFATHRFVYALNSYGNIKWGRSHEQMNINKLGPVLAKDLTQHTQQLDIISRLTPFIFLVTSTGIHPPWAFPIHSWVSCHPRPAASKMGRRRRTDHVCASICGRSWRAI